jgi:hypothetical protein
MLASMAEVDSQTQSILLAVVAVLTIIFTSLILRVKRTQNATNIESNSNMGLLELASGDSPTIELVLSSMYLCQIEHRIGKHCRNTRARWGSGDVLEGWRCVMASWSTTKANSSCTNPHLWIQCLYSGQKFVTRKLMGLRNQLSLSIGQLQGWY